MPYLLLEASLFPSSLKKLRREGGKKMEESMHDFQWLSYPKSAFGIVEYIAPADLFSKGVTSLNRVCQKGNFVIFERVIEGHWLSRWKNERERQDVA